MPSSPCCHKGPLHAGKDCQTAHRNSGHVFLFCKETHTHTVAPQEEFHSPWVHMRFTVFSVSLVLNTFTLTFIPSAEEFRISSEISWCLGRVLFDCTGLIELFCVMSFNMHLCVFCMKSNKWFYNLLNVMHFIWLAMQWWFLFFFFCYMIVSLYYLYHSKMIRFFFKVNI